MQNNRVANVFKVLQKRDRIKLCFIAVLQALLSFLDLFAIFTFGLLGLLLIQGANSSGNSGVSDIIFKVLPLDGKELKIQFLILGVVTSFLFLLKTIFASILSRKILYFLNRRGAEISADMISKLLAGSLNDIQKLTSQEIIYSLTRGVESITVSVIATTLVLVSDISLVFVLGFALLFVDPLTAAATIIFFVVIGIVLDRITHRKANILGQIATQLNIQSSEKVTEVLGSYREAIVGNRRNYYSREFRKIRARLANTLAELYFMPYVSKYVIELALVLGVVILGICQFLLQSPGEAIAGFTIFIGAATRLAPAILRIQQGLLQIRSGLGIADSTLELMSSLHQVQSLPSTEDLFKVKHDDFVAHVSILNLSFSYPGRDKRAIDRISLEINDGESIALVGPSGAGKTTLVDLILGALVPDSGQILISGAAPALAFSRWPGAVGYVPQNVMAFNGTIRENISAGYPTQVIADELILEALEKANLGEFLKRESIGLNSMVGEQGSMLSGGQRQRLGIARALLSKPRLLVLDEATSSLDAVTESEISRTLIDLKGMNTLIIVAHRLSTVQSVDKVVYIDEGKILAVGSFSEVRTKVSNFDEQAKLIGL
jgi:ABC-type multidrug transport system fused ATPase/permease subunit